MRKYAGATESEFCVITDDSQTYGYFSKVDKMSCDHLFSLFLGSQKNWGTFFKIQKPLESFNVKINLNE